MTVTFLFILFKCFSSLLLVKGYVMQDEDINIEQVLRNHPDLQRIIQELQNILNNVNTIQETFQSLRGNVRDINVIQNALQELLSTMQEVHNQVVSIAVQREQQRGRVQRGQQANVGGVPTEEPMQGGDDE